MISRRDLPNTIRFGPAKATPDAGEEYNLDLESFELRQRGRPVRIRPRAARALAVLLQNEGRMVPCEQLRMQLWGTRHLEWRNGLHRCLRDVRRALSDDARHPRFVATVGSLGYRFVGRCAAPAPSGRPAQGWHRQAAAFAAGVALVLVAAVAFVLFCLAATSQTVPRQGTGPVPRTTMMEQRNVKSLRPGTERQRNAPNRQTTTNPLRTPFPTTRSS